MRPPNGVGDRDGAGERGRRRPAGARRTPLWIEAWRRFRRHRLAIFGAVVLVVMVIAVVAGPFVYRVPINEIDFKAKLKARRGPIRSAPTTSARTCLPGCSTVAHLPGGGRGRDADRDHRRHRGRGRGRHLGGAVDNALMRLTDLFLALPQLPLLLLIIYLFRDALRRAGPGDGRLPPDRQVIGGLRWMPVARLVRAQFLSLREKEFVEAARGLGAGRSARCSATSCPTPRPGDRGRHPRRGRGDHRESTLSFLGLGFPPDIPTWGRILFDAKDNLDFAPHWAIFPGTAIFLTVLSINFIGDGLRDALDPRKVLWLPAHAIPAGPPPAPVPAGPRCAPRRPRPPRR